jgi:hypothetical protein
MRTQSFHMFVTEAEEVESWCVLVDGGYSWGANSPHPPASNNLGSTSTCKTRAISYTLTPQD